MTDYYSILQLNKDASLDDVRRAYRKLARQYHPDVNHQANAQEMFIAITEAYEYLINKIKYQQQQKYESKQDIDSNREAQIIIDEWLTRERERIRNRARMHANMHFKQFRKTPYYKATETRQIQIISLLAIMVGIFVIFGSVMGSLKVIHENEKLRNISYVGASIIVFIVGVIIVTVGIAKLISSRTETK